MALNKYDILVEALLMEIPHIKLNDKLYVDLRLEDILGDQDKLRKRIKEFLTQDEDQNAAVYKLKNDTSFLVIAKKYFDMSTEDIDDMLENLIKDTED